MTDLDVQDLALADGFIGALEDFAEQPDVMAQPLGQTLHVVMLATLGFAFEQPGAARATLHAGEVVAARELGVSPEQIEVETRGLMRRMKEG